MKNVILLFYVNKYIEFLTKNKTRNFQMIENKIERIY